MDKSRAPLLLLAIFMIMAQTVVNAQKAPPTTAPPPEKLKVVPDLAQRVAKYKPVQVPLQVGQLNPRERQLVQKLVEASHYIEDIFWRQSDPEGLALYQELTARNDPAEQNLRQFLFINASRFDLLEENQPFVCTESAATANGGNCPAMYPGRGFFPNGLTREQIEQYVKAHPEARAQIYSGTTVIRRNADQLQAVPYHEAYRQFLEPAAKALREAADLSDEPQFANFLRKRADALLTDDYYASDIAWLELQNPRFDIIYAPYETYLDDLMGVKTSYGAAVLVRNELESKKLAVYQKFIPDIQDALPLPPADRPSKRGHQSPMEVMDTPFRAGDLNHGYQAVADNLPNDPRIHQEKGTKKIFFKNFMDARVNFVILPIAKRIMRADQAALASAAGYMASTLLHEISHGLGPAFARQSGKQVDIREAIGPAYSGLEEAKADVVGMYGLKFLTDKGVLPRTRLPQYYCSYVAGIFRTVRFGIAEAHGKAEMMEFNYLFEQKAIQRDASGRYFIEYARMATALASLAKELLEQEATGDRARAENWFKRYGTMPDHLKAGLAKVADVPVDLTPTFSFPQTVR